MSNEENKVNEYRDDLINSFIDTVNREKEDHFALFYGAGKPDVTNPNLTEFVKVGNYWFVDDNELLGTMELRDFIESVWEDYMFLGYNTDAPDNA